jgi:hypothetical protein
MEAVESLRRPERDDSVDEGPQPGLRLGTPGAVASATAHGQPIAARAQQTIGELTKRLSGEPVELANLAAAELATRS